MGKGKRSPGQKKAASSEESLRKGILLVRSHPLLGQLEGDVEILDRSFFGKEGFAFVSSRGFLYVNKDAIAAPEEWLYLIAHNLLHLAFGHFDGERMPEGGRGLNTHIWNWACDIFIAKFLSEIRVDRWSCPTPAVSLPLSLDSEEKIYEQILQKENRSIFSQFGTNGPTSHDMHGLERPLFYGPGSFNRAENAFAWALASCVSKEVSAAGGHDEVWNVRTRSQQAAEWFLSHYPLLGGLAAGFKVLEDNELCRRSDIQIAAVNVEEAEIYVNPAAGLTFDELKFVLAHEFLHAGLLHHLRCRGRNPYLWNIACDFVINGWLMDMGVGTMPQLGLFWDEEFRGLSAETIYDRLSGEIRKYGKISTFRGYGKGDMLDSPGLSGPRGIDMDEFYRNALSQGLEYHKNSDRGLLPAGLLQEISALAMPAIPWDVELAKWFDDFFPPLEKRHTYSRPSRRQGSTPDIPRPRYVPDDSQLEGRTFGVVLDTSGSMDTKLLAKALGCIASYAAARDVPFARVVFCDARAYDGGYMAPQEIAGRVTVKGRGGTVLQPGIDLLQNAKDFPGKGPILLITDGGCENKITLRRDHAWLLPQGAVLPFRPKGKTFWIQ